MTLDEHSDHRGHLTVVEPGRHVDFDVRRVYYVYGVPDGAERGAHGHRRLRQLIVALHGAFDLVLDDGHATERFRLDHPSHGVLVEPMVWRTLTGFAPATVGLCLASEPYDESDYYRDRAAFLRDAAGASGP